MRKRVTMIAVNMDTTTPSSRVLAKPWMEPVPKNSSTMAAIRVVTLASRIADMAFLKPARTAAFTLRPRRISSLKRSKMMTFASTAIPMPSTTPARPGRVSWIWKIAISMKSRIV